MVTRLDRAYEVQVHQLRLRVVNFSTRFWDGMGSWRDEDVERLLETVTPIVQSGQQRISDLTDAYLTRVAGELGVTVRGRPFEAVTKNLRGVTDEDIYARPLATMHAALADGKTVTGAISEGKNRLKSIVETNLQLAKTHSSRRAMQAGGIEYYERVLTGRENCALCIIASTQRYRVKDLSPIHSGCDCQVRPLPGSAELVVHPDRLEAVHSAITDRFGDTDRSARVIADKNYRSLIAFHEHGEVGPTLTWRDQHFTTQAEIRA